MKRLFDIFELNAKNKPNSVLFGKKDHGTWKKIYYKEAVQQVNNLAVSILDSIGIPTIYDEHHQSKIGIISNNRPEWIVTDLGVQEAGGILVPIYPTVGLPDLEYIIQESNLKMIFVSNKEIYDRFKPVLVKYPIKIYSFDKVDGVENWETLLIQKSSEDSLNKSKENITEDTVATIIYTSGTTGKPKGVMLTHKNIVSNVKDCTARFSFAVEDSKALSFLPLNHIFEKTLTYIYMLSKVSIYYAESLDTIGENLKEVQPTVFTCVPRVLEKVYTKIVDKGKELTGIKKALFFWALKLAQRYDNHKNQGAWYNLQLTIANKLIFSKWREALGGNVLAVVSGSAALNPELIRIFTAAGIIIMEGYGLTETSPVISVNTYENEGRRFGTVGYLVDNVQVKIAEDGEILVKGNNVMKGYYNNPEATKQEINEEGWFKTGDIGTYQNGFLTITDRKKEIFKTSGGKYVAPQFVENVYRTVDVISQIMIIGNGRKFVSAVIVPDWEVVAKKLNGGVALTEQQKKEFTTNPELIDLVSKGIEWSNPQINHIEQVKKFVLLSEEWTVDNGILTPKLSLKRKVVEQKFSDLIEKMYT